MAMWRPKERIRYDVAGGHWPTAAEAGEARLFQPLQIGPVMLSGRTWVPAMVPWRADDEGFVTSAVIDWYRRFAEGRPAAIVVEATGIRDVPSGPLLRIGHDRFIPGLRELVAAVREASAGETKLFIQIIDFLSVRRRPEPHKYFERFLRITDDHRRQLHLQDAPEEVVRQALLALDEPTRLSMLSPREAEALEKGYRERVTDLELPHVEELPRTLPTLFAQAARRAAEAGFDGVELHYAHAYTMSSFLSRTNERGDGYGGSLEGRIRLPLEVYHAVRAAVPAHCAVGCRLLAEECIDGGSTVEDAVYFAKALAGAGMDFISLSRGGKFDDALPPKVGEAVYPYTGPSGYECMPSYYSDAKGPFGRNQAAAQTIRQALRAAGLTTPTVVAGGVHNFERAEALLAEEVADVVGVARQALADPDFFIKIRSGCGAEVRLCKYTNYCEALDGRHKEVTCELWDREGLDEPGLSRSSDGKRRLLAPAWRR
jgi:hypothetical protein